MIGKLFRGGFLETKRTKRETKEEEKKCQTITTISENLLRRQPGQLGTTFARCAGRTTPLGGSCEWDAGGDEKTNRTKGDKIAGGKREKGSYKNISKAAART